MTIKSHPLIDSHHKLATLPNIVEPGVHSRGAKLKENIES